MSATVRSDEPAAAAAAQRDAFFRLADAVSGALRAGEEFLLRCSGEDSDFVRLNHGRVRQAGAVRQRRLSLQLVADGRSATVACDAGGGDDSDRERLLGLVSGLRVQLAHLPADPHLLFSREALTSSRIEPGRLPDPASAIDRLITLADGLDLVGIWASGLVHRGLATSAGTRAWHSVGTFNLDWSCYHTGDKAVKCAYAGTSWNESVLAARLSEARRTLPVLARSPQRLSPGAYRAYLAPAALDDLLGMCSWGGFSCKAQRTRSGPLLRLHDGAERLHPAVTLTEDHAGGLSPGFTDAGFAKPASVPLITAGSPAGSLVGARSAREFALVPNCAHEAPESLRMDAGDLPAETALHRLGTGLWISNVWYCNFSDRSACRITGMTRFACLWIENGEPVAPLAVMRFDDTIYRLLGANLEALTCEREHVLEAGTYGGRGLGSSLLPGALVGEIALTL